MMNTNLLIALKNLVNKPVTSLTSYFSAANRMNGVGDALEVYVKDLFCGTFSIEKYEEKVLLYPKYFSYDGNDTNPPDIMIRGGDAVEIKKLESFNADLALNSSYPKDKLYSDGPMITTECRACEDWKVKDVLYVVGGVTRENGLKSLWFIYGDCYAASRETYERIKEKISSGLTEIKGVELSETKELGRVNKVDPLGITNLRIRGMWTIQNPNKLFKFTNLVDETDFVVNALMLKAKYDSFPEIDRKNLEKMKVSGFSITDIKIPSPNNPKEMLDAKLISYIK